MTEITWEQAREKVLDRHPSAYCCSVANAVFPHAEVYPSGEHSEPLGKTVGIPINTLEPRVWLNAYARMTDTTVVPPEGLPSSQCAKENAHTKHTLNELIEWQRDAKIRAGLSDAPPSFEADMQRAIDHGNVSARMEALQAEVERYRLALSLACELHGCADAHCSPTDYLDDAGKIMAQLAAANEQIARLTGAVPCINPIEKPTRCSIGEFGNIVRVPDGEFYLASEAEGHMQIIERQLQTATEALAAERSLRESWENVARLALPRAETLQSDNTRSRDALGRYQQAAESWHRFHHGSSSVQCDAICELIPVGRAALAAVEGKGGL